eukprot:7435426-Pyramimonas_sp.AAC.2
MIRSSPWSEWFLRELLNMRDWVEYLGGSWRDQKALTILLHKYPDIHSHIRVVEASVMEVGRNIGKTVAIAVCIQIRVNCKYSKAGGKAKINKCQSKFLEQAQQSREESYGGGHLIGKLPSMDELDLKASKVRPTLLESFRCMVRKLALIHLDTSQTHQFPTKPYALHADHLHRRRGSAIEGRGGGSNIDTTPSIRRSEAR